jgi:flagellar motility protein MotE (MotC chaperone)
MLTRLLQSRWVVPLIGGLLYLATTAALIRPQQIAEALPPPTTKLSSNNEPSWKFRNPEFEQIVEELRQEKQNLATREQQLQELQTRLQAERQELLAITQTVHQLQVDFDKGVVRLKEQEVENLKRQSKIISGMTPEGAATMLYEMPEDQMVRALFSLKPDNAGLILEALSKQGKEQAKRAANATDRLRTVLPP